jgi:quinol monooxygenase YgiN
MKTRPGHRDDVVSILLDGIDRFRTAGCHAYIVSLSNADSDTIHVTEVWQSKAHHEASLQLPDVKASIAKAMPMLAGEFTSEELNVVGGLGLSPPSKAG